MKKPVVTIAFNNGRRKDRKSVRVDTFGYEYPGPDKLPMDI